MKNASCDTFTTVFTKKHQRTVILLLYVPKPFQAVYKAVTLVICCFDFLHEGHVGSYKTQIELTYFCNLL